MKRTLQVFAAVSVMKLALASALAFCLLMPFAASAQHSSDAMHSSGVQSSELLKGYSFSFSFVAKDAKGVSVYNAKGDIVVSGPKFRMEIPQELIVVSDGKTQWVYNCSNDEILISESEFSQQLASASNPLEMAEKLAGIFVGANKGYEKAVVNKDKAGNPVEVVIKWAKGSYVIRILGAVVEKNTPPEMFALDVRNFPEAVITDLRKPLL